MRAERNVWDTTKMAGLVANQKGYVDRLTYRMWLPIVADASFRATSGAWNSSGSFGRVWRATNGTTNYVWNIKKPEDWIRGQTIAYVWCTPRLVGAATGRISLNVRLRLVPIGLDYEVTLDHVDMINSTTSWTVQAAEIDALLKVERVGIVDVSHGEDGILILRVLRTSGTSDEELDIYGIELLHYPAIER